jgi:hypothetical protein
VNVHSSTDKSHPGILNLCKTLVSTKKEQMARVRDCVTRFIVQSTSSGFSRSALTPGGGSIAGCDIGPTESGGAVQLWPVMACRWLKEFFSATRYIIAKDGQGVVRRHSM